MPMTRKIENAELNKQLKSGAIDPAMSEWPAPVLFLSTKNDKLWLCIYYGKLNSMTIKDTSPLLKMDDCIDTLGEEQYFTKMNSYSGYWRINKGKQYRHIIVFICHT